jgi:pimeloyl-ACP methyl ester carboxylesterase
MQMLCLKENYLRFVEYGNPEGKTVIYFHGAPGSPEECSIFDGLAKEYGLNIVCFDRFAIDTSLKNKDYYKFLASAISDKAQGKKVDLIGFSIGCHTAIETSVYLDSSVRNLHLISAAAPLDAADFLDDMAGKMVFTLAMKRPTIFILLSYWQTLIAKIAPNVLFNLFFGSAKGEDETLSKSSVFKRYITPILAYCFSKNVKGYIRDIKQYVTHWNGSVMRCTSNTYIWHGTNDNWSPVSMAQYLNNNLPASSKLELMKGLSHYSCLHSAVPKICAQLAKA